jgi:hypothetical protein
LVPSGLQLLRKLCLQSWEDLLHPVPVTLSGTHPSLISTATSLDIEQKKRPVEYSHNSLRRYPSSPKKALSTSKNLTFILKVSLLAEPF